jgi:hypothetical protein
MPRINGPQPRSTAATPMVAMMTATTGRPSRGRSTILSSPKPKPIMTTRTATMAAIRGACAPSTVTTTMPASMTNSPWAKLMASVAL